MPIPILIEVYENGFENVPWLPPILKCVPWVLLTWLLKIYFGGATNIDERVMHSKVAIVTGGTSGIGAAIVNDLAARGTQLILLVSNPSDVFTVDYISDLRSRHNNNLIYAEKCDLSDLHSVRQFATKFIDNSPPRRLDMVICAAGHMDPPFLGRSETKDGVERHLQLNYLGHWHLLNILQPLLKVQPPDRDVRVLLATCGSHILGELDLSDLEWKTRPYPSRAPWKVYGASKLALMSFGIELQRRLNGYKRPDQEVMNARVFNIDPGFTRTPGSRRWLTLGSLWGLLVYIVMWPLWWLVLKSPQMGAQSFLNAAMSPEWVRKGTQGGVFIRECRDEKYRKEGIEDPELGKQLWEVTEKLVAAVEKRTAIERKRAELEALKKDPEAKKKKAEEKKKEQENKVKLEQKRKEQEARAKLLEKLIKEEEARGVTELPPLVKKEVVDPEVLEKELKEKEKREKERKEKVLDVPEDAPARNTRSRSKTPAPEAAAMEPTKSEGSQGKAKRRTRKA